MPVFHSPERAPAANTAAADSGIQFPIVTRDHILHCSYDYWFPKYRKECIRSRIIKLPPEFIEYIREDGIILSSDDPSTAKAAHDDDEWEPTADASASLFPGMPDQDAHSDSDSDSDDSCQLSGPSRVPPDQRFPELHNKIKDTIKELGGKVAPKLNWSSPRDAVWISPHQNTIKCTSPSDIYLLLKSSNFITHDLEHAFHGTVPTNSPPAAAATGIVTDLGFQPVLVLRCFFEPHPAMEFRCFVKQRSLVAITPRDLNYYPFQQRLRPAITARVKQLFNDSLRFTFPDGNFSFDVYIPEEHNLTCDDDEDEAETAHEDAGKRLGRARLIDINPWAPRTDTLLFSWDELLELLVPNPMIGTTGAEYGVVGLRTRDEDVNAAAGGDDGSEEEQGEDEEEEKNDDYEPELRLVDHDDPAAFNFSSHPYSAHKLPKDVVDACSSGGGALRDFADQWNELVNARR